MRFRTEIECRPSPWKIDHATPLLMLGSCFTDEIGKQLANDGFDVIHNPFGPLYNPMSLARSLDRALSRQLYSESDLVDGPRGFHCLDYASRYSSDNATTLLADINSTLSRVSDQLQRNPVVIITLGSAFVYKHNDTDSIVGNCHKFPASAFTRIRVSVDDIYDRLAPTIDSLKAAGVRHIVFTVSPIRHLSDGLHGNMISKSTLLLAAERIVESYSDFCSYFPSYEIMLDDLRDYRFYASDMKHPSQVAVDYIYEVFSDVYFTASTRKEAAEARRRYLAAQHRPIL